MKKRAFTILLILVFFVGLCLMLYPIVFDMWNTMRQKTMIAQYEQAISSPDTSPASAGEAGQTDYEIEEFAKAQAYNARLIQNFTIDTEDEALHQEYMQLLNPGDMEIMGVLYIPKIDVKLPIYHGTGDGVLQVGIGHLEGTSLPVGGYGSHCVLSGHTGLPSARLLTDLTRLNIGDQFSVVVMDKELHYRIDQIKIVLPTELDDLLIEPGRDYITLVTCTPYGINSHRLLVRGRRYTVVDIPEVVPDAIRYNRYTVAIMFGTPPSVLCVLIGAFVIYRKGKRENAMLLAKLREEGI